MSLAPDQDISVSEGGLCKVALLIPAHNEEQCIQNTILSVLKQTICNLSNTQVDVFIIADNCTDQTEKVVLVLIQELKEQERFSVFLLRSENNTSRKAGALNQGYLKIRESGYTYIATADADTVWDAQFLEHGLAAMAKHQEALGGICGRVGLLPYQKEPFKQVSHAKKSTFATFGWLLLDCLRRIAWVLHQAWRYIWWSFQNIEYSLAQSETIEHMGKAHCLCGPGTIYRTEVLEQLYQDSGLVWPETLVEDFDITLSIQTKGYKTFVGHDMFVYTDCPIGFKAHGIQRERWNGGDLSTYMHVGMNRHTFFDGTEMGWQLIWFACRLNLVMTGIQIYLSGFVYIDTVGYVLLTVPLLLTVCLNLLRFKYVAYKSIFQFLLVVCLGYELYALWYGVVLTKSYIKAFTHSLNRWR